MLTAQLMTVQEEPAVSAVYALIIQERTGQQARQMRSGPALRTDVVAYTLNPRISWLAQRRRGLANEMESGGFL